MEDHMHRAIPNQLSMNADGDAYDLFSDWRARRDERAYTLLNNLIAYIVIAHAAGQYPIEVVRAAQIDTMVAQLSIDVARRQDAK